MSLLSTCSKCGCQDDFLVTPHSCPTSVGCPTPEPCYTVTDAQCSIYTGPAIICGDITIVASNTDMSTALQAVVAYFCALHP